MSVKNSFGGEGKTAKIEKMESDLLQEIEDTSLILNNKLFKVYLATPAIFEKGYLPKWIDENSLNELILISPDFSLPNPIPSQKN